MVTIRAVADRAGVSVGTVSNVLNRPSYVTPDTRVRVLVAIDELGFVPTQYRRQFRAGRERVLGCVMVDLANPFFVDVALGVEGEANDRGAGVVLSHSGEDVIREENNLDILIQLRVHGIIVAPVEDENPRLEELRLKGVPLVFLDRLDPRQEISTVSVDHVEGGRLAGAHLAGLGHTSFAFIEGPVGSHLVRDRHSGLATGVAEAGVPASSIVTITAGGWTTEDGVSAGSAYLDLDPKNRPTAVFCSNDMIAKGFLRAVQNAGLSVPGHVSVVGYDDLEWAGDLSVPLTTIRQPREQLGREATSMLMEIIDDLDGGIKHVTLQPELVVRDSTAGPRQGR